MALLKEDLKLDFMANRALPEPPRWHMDFTLLCYFRSFLNCFSTGHAE